jgi:dolichyl-diphosphooligosaccharide--protein glycosyltransferase
VFAGQPDGSNSTKGLKTCLISNNQCPFEEPILLSFSGGDQINGWTRANDYSNKPEIVSPVAMSHPQPHQAGQFERMRHRMLWLTIAAIVMVALFIRLDDLRAWIDQPHKAFYNGQPILTNFDGYFYLSLARDLLEHEYDPVDTFRGVPESQKRPMPPPLISLVTAAIAKISSVSIDWIAALLPAFLGLFLAVPLYLFSRLFGGGVMALVALSVGLSARYYVYRSSVGWFDTDCLNATFALMITYLFLRFGMVSTYRRYAYLTGGFCVFLFFLLWWDQTRTAVTMIALCPLTVVMALFYRPQGRERWLALATVAVIVSGLLVWNGPQVFRLPVEKTLVALGYITKTQSGQFPNTAQSVMEQMRPGFQSLARISTGNLATFIIGLAGLTWMLIIQTRRAAPLMVVFGLGCLAFLFARRFTIFLNPFLAIGLGYAAQQLWDFRSKWPFLKYIAPAGALLVCIFSAKDSLHRVYWPKEIPPIVEGMQLLSQTTAGNALIWAWWDHGYPLRYWSQRATINDGSLHNGPRTVSNAIPLSSMNPRQAANFIQFYAVRGVQGLQTVIDRSGTPTAGMRLMQRVFEAGPEQAESVLGMSGLVPVDEWRRFFFPPQERDIYLFLDLRLARTAYWWHWFGTWDMASQEGTHGQFQLFRNCRLGKQRLEGPELSIDLASGVLILQQRRLPLARFYHNDGRHVRRIDYPRSKGLFFAFHEASRVGALMDRTFSETVFNQLYMYENPDLRYFSLHAQRFPYYQIWQVTSDTADVHHPNEKNVPSEPEN